MRRRAFTDPWSLTGSVLAVLCACAPPTGPAPHGAPSDTEATDAGVDPVAFAPVVINEVACGADDWIELANPGAEIADVSGYLVNDGAGVDQRAFVVPTGTRILPGGFKVLRRQTPDEDGLRFGLSCGDDSVRVTTPDHAVLDTVALPALRSGQTWSRVPDASGDFAPGAPTPAAPNRAWVDETLALFADDSTIDIAITLGDASRAALDAQPYEYVSGTMAITAPAALAVGPLSVGVRLKGVYGSFRSLGGKAAFRIDADRDVDGQQMLGLEHFVLNNMVQDPSYLHEVLAYELFAAVGVPAPRARYARVSVDDTPYGLYLLLEAWDEASLARIYPGTTHLYEGEYGGDVDSPLEIDVGDEDRADLEALRDALQAPAAERYDALLAVVDLAEMQRMWAAERVLAHWDGYVTVNNYFLHSDADGRFTMLPWGTDQTFGGDVDFFQGGVLLRSCLALPECLEGYLDAIEEVTDTFEALELDVRLDEIAARIADDIADDTRREFDPAFAVDQQSATRAFIVARAAQVRDALTVWRTDADGDGVSVLADCDDGNADIHAGAVDTCDDDIDQDCDGNPDNGLGCPDCDARAIDGTLYHVCRTPRTFEDAAAYCDSIGASLLTVESAEEDTRLANAGLGGFWAGYSDIEEEGVWRDVDGNSADYQPFADGEPNNCCGGEDCVEVWGAGAWNDAACEVPHLTLCEEPCLATPVDADGDGVASALTCGSDCDDEDDAVFPGAAEVCGDGVDQDCNGRIDDDAACPLPCSLVGLGTHDYAFCAHGLSAPAARQQCEERGMTLVQVGSDAEFFWLRGQAWTYGVDAGWYWMDASDEADEGIWVDASGAPLAYERFLAGEPNDPGSFEDCALSLFDGWVDAPCFYGATFVCEEACSEGDLDGDGANDCGADCDDTDAAIHPGGAEICGDGIDQDCTGVADDGCPPPPVQCTEMDLDGRTIALCGDAMFQGAAHDQCAARGMGLLRIDDAAEATAIKGLLADIGWSGTGVWIDASDDDNEGVWVHADGSPVEFLPWLEGEPNDPGGFEDCVALFADRGGLEDRFCGDGWPFVCEAP